MDFRIRFFEELTGESLQHQFEGQTQSVVIMFAKGLSAQNLYLYFEVMWAKVCRAPVMQSIVLLIVYCVFRSSLTDFPSRPVRLCRSRWPSTFVGRYCVLLDPQKRHAHSRTLETFGWRSKESLGAQWLRNNAVQTFVQAESSYSATSTGTSSLATLWEQTGEASRIPRTRSRFQTRLWTVPPLLSESSEAEGRAGSLAWAAARGRKPSGVWTRFGREKWVQFTFWSLVPDTCREMEEPPGLENPGMEMNRGTLSCRCTKWK